MVFSSISFLFFFLSFLFICYFGTPKKYRNYVLLIFSLLFYFLGEKWYVLLLLFSCFINYLLGLLIPKKKKKFYLIMGLIFNIGLLFYFKYTNFFLKTFANLFNLSVPTLNIILPLGISFFTFQNISYLIDVYRNDVDPEKNFLNYATYITFFPQIIAGPIVRYQDIAKELKNRNENMELFSEGVTRFIIGLAKKVIIADTIYQVYTNILNSNMSMLSYILVAICFTLQLYYDFSGYSDMAIGLGKMFGFNFKENFNYPLASFSITGFWHRWHISLSTFFKDYLYILLGGNKCSKMRNIFNLFIVWFLTGLWHGASTNFILWGIYFFVILVLEKFVLKKYLKKNIFSYIYTFIVINISFVIFNITDLKELGIFLKGMLGIGVPIYNQEILYYFKNNFIILLIAFLGISPFIKNKINNLKKGKWQKIINGGEVIFLFLIFILAVASIVSNSFKPFIYFRF